MQAQAKLRDLAISPRKVRLVVDLIRGNDVPRSLALLKFVNKKSALPIKKLLQSAVANWHQKQPTQEKTGQKMLYIKQVEVGSAGMAKRLKPGPQGRASRIRKRRSHVTLVVAQLSHLLASS